MKRSKALEEIRKILAMNGKDNGEGELEEALLHAVESLGMLPPLVHPIHYHTLDQIEYLDSRFKKWEPEDEEK
jgi:hypothetical protein